MAHVKGLHQARGLPIGNLVHLDKASGGKLSSKLARLDHQRGLLERQLAVWTQKQKVTKKRLSLLLDEIAAIEQLVRAQRGAGRHAGRRKRVRAASSRSDQAGTTPRQREFSVEY
jgi:hypothetical protein